MLLNNSANTSKARQSMEKNTTGTQQLIFPYMQS